MMPISQAEGGAFGTGQPQWVRTACCVPLSLPHLWGISPPPSCTPCAPPSPSSFSYFAWMLLNFGEPGRKSHSSHLSYRDSPNHGPLATWLHTSQQRAFLKACSVLHARLVLGYWTNEMLQPSGAFMRSKEPRAQHEVRIARVLGPGPVQNEWAKGVRIFSWRCNATTSSKV